MKQELQQKLFDKYPKIFRQKDLSIQETCMCWGIETLNGWYSLIDNLCSYLQRNTDKNNKEYVIKNKIVRKIWPILNNLVRAIPGKYNFNKKRQYNPLIFIRRQLVTLLYNWRKTREFIYIDTQKYPQIEAVQVKEKYGGLRFYVNGATDTQYAVISFAESLSYNICEYCSTMENVGQTQGWVSTICKDCHSKIDNMQNLIWKANE